jgi:hypothetical protein
MISVSFLPIIFTALGLVIVMLIVIFKPLFLPPLSLSFETVVARLCDHTVL